MKKILIKVRQRKLLPGQALNLLQDEYINDINDGFKCRFWSKEMDDRILYVLEAVWERTVITIQEAEIEILGIIEEETKWIRAKRIKIRKSQTICA